MKGPQWAIIFILYHKIKIYQMFIKIYEVRFLQISDSSEKLSSLLKVTRQNGTELGLKPSKPCLFHNMGNTLSLHIHGQCHTYVLSLLLLKLLVRLFIIPASQSLSIESCLITEMAGIKQRGQGHGQLGGMPSFPIHLLRFPGQCLWAQYTFSILMMHLVKGNEKFLRKSTQVIDSREGDLLCQEKFLTPGHFSFTLECEKGS